MGFKSNKLSDYIFMVIIFITLVSILGFIFYKRISPFTISNKHTLIDNVYNNQKDFYNMSYTEINNKHDWVDSVIYEAMTDYIHKEKLTAKDSMISKKEIEKILM